ncbi:MAG: hypothetical protein GKR94_23920 [Gammaproteobacteria bacterium]|nr:hypothetical protein [Gammaproteobacteria bacterium]
MPTVTKRVPVRELPADWREAFADEALVEVRLTSVPIGPPAQDRLPALKELVDRIQPRPSKSGDVVKTIRTMREERTQAITGRR